MVIHSPFPNVDFQRTNIVFRLFPPGGKPSEEPLWIDSKDTKVSLSPAQLLGWMKRLACGLGKAGLKRGDVVMIYTPNHIFVPASYLGVAGGGYAFSGASPVYTANELAHQLKNTEARILLAHPALIKNAIAAVKQAGLPKNRVFQFSDAENPTIDGVKDWRHLLSTPEEAARYSWPELTPEESKNTIATINYSSGTTGLPKGVCVSHYNLNAMIEQTIFIKYHLKPYSFADRPPERWIGFLPLYHAYGQLYTILMAVILHVPVYVMKQFMFEEFLQNIQQSKITTLHVAPPVLVMLSKRPETAKYDLSTVTDVLCGAAPLPNEVRNDVSKRFKVQINNGWGMAEVTCGAMMVPGGVDDDSGSVGQLIPNTDCELRDDEGKVVGVGERGEIFVRGPQICMGYWRNEEATRDSLQDGWLKTGDVAVVDERGYFWIVDRKKELIKVNGLQVSPAELEALLLEHEHVADAAVVGIILHGEEWPRAYVVLQEGAKSKVKPLDIQEWIKPKVAKHKWLAGGVTFVDEVPKLASGKIQRKVMREWSKADAKMLEGEIKSRF